MLDENWHYLTDIKHYGVLEKDNIFNTFHLYSDLDREIIYENGKYTLINKGIKVKEFGENKIFKYKFTRERPYQVSRKSKYLENCIFSVINIIHWRLVPKTKKYYYNIDFKERYIPLEYDTSSFMFIDKSLNEVVSVDDIDLNDLYIREYTSSLTPSKNEYKHGFSSRVFPSLIKNSFKGKVNGNWQSCCTLVSVAALSNDALFYEYMNFDKKPNYYGIGDYTNRESMLRSEMIRRGFICDLAALNNL